MSIKLSTEHSEFKAMGHCSDLHYCLNHVIQPLSWIPFDKIKTKHIKANLCVTVKRNDITHLIIKTSCPKLLIFWVLNTGQVLLYSKGLWVLLALFSWGSSKIGIFPRYLPSTKLVYLPTSILHSSERCGTSSYTILFLLWTKILPPGCLGLCFVVKRSQYLFTFHNHIEQFLIISIYDIYTCVYEH